jgi:ribonuclease E
MGANVNTLGSLPDDPKTNPLSDLDDEGLEDELDYDDDELDDDDDELDDDDYDDDGDGD